MGCFGCAIAPNILCLDAMRCVTGIGGGGLITMGKSIYFTPACLLGGTDDRPPPRGALTKCLMRTWEKNLHREDGNPQPFRSGH
jgi:hypothetical protein